MKQKRIFDLHLDLEVYLTYPKFLNMKFTNLAFLDLKRHGDIPQFKKSGLKFAVVNIFPFEYINNNWIPINLDKFFVRLNKFLKWLKKFNDFCIVLNKNELTKLINIRKIGIILGVEGLNFLDKPEQVYKLYERGIRVFGLNWNIDSLYSSSLKTQSKTGLTKNGIKLIKILEKLPVIIDLAHSSIYTCQDVFKHYKKPVIFSHNGIRKVVDFEQNLDDKILKIIQQRNSLIGLTLLPYSINSDFSYWLKQLKDYREQYKDNLALGTDFFGFKFNKSYKGFINYLDFYESIKKYKLPNYFLFNNAFKLFSQLL